MVEDKEANGFCRVRHGESFPPDEGCLRRTDLKAILGAMHSGIVIMRLNQVIE